MEGHQPYIREHPYQPQYRKDKHLQQELGIGRNDYHSKPFARSLWREWRNGGCVLTPEEVVARFDDYKVERSDLTTQTIRRYTMRYLK